MARWLFGILDACRRGRSATRCQVLRADVGRWLRLERVVVTGATVGIVGWVLLVLTDTGYGRRLSTTLRGLVFVPPAVGVLAAWSNHDHGQFWQSQPPPEILTAAGSRYLRSEPGA